MKKVIYALSLWIAGAAFNHVNAQISAGGIPLSFAGTKSYVDVPVSQFTSPDWDSLDASWNAKIKSGSALPLLVASKAELDVTYPTSGVFTEINGQKVWRATVVIPDAPAMGFYFDQFQLPKGARFFITNDNANQILGAYTSDVNDESLTFATEPIQGHVAHLEIDLDSATNINDVKFHINNAAVYYRSIKYLNQYLNPMGDPSFVYNVYDSLLLNGSSSCMINAICPLANHYEIQRDGALQVVQPASNGFGLCSASMINTADNAVGSCKHYVLYASHCDNGSNTSSTYYNQTLYRFNYQQSTCNENLYEIPNNTHTLTGANFKARSLINKAPGASDITVDSIRGDFLLVELRYDIPTSWGVNLLGWSNSTVATANYTYPKKLIEFHHPGGDIKKVTTYNSIQSTGAAASNSHWMVQADSGLIAEGSSGSSLLNGDGKIIGIASYAYIGYGVDSSCYYSLAGEDVHGSTSTVLAFSKFSNDWSYSVDGSSDASKLQPWLDPANSGVTTVAPVTSTCAAISDTTGGNEGNTTGISNTPDELGNSFTVYPNPSSTGMITLTVNMKDLSNLDVQILDISGKKLQGFPLSNVRSGSFNVNLSGYASGMYFIQVADGKNISTKKIMLTK